MRPSTFRFLFFGIILTLLLAVAQSYLVPTAMGGICAILLFPAKQRLKRTTKLGAFVMTLAIACLFVIPLFLLLIYTAKNAFLELDELKGIFEIKESKSDFITTVFNITPIRQSLEWVADRFPISTKVLSDAIVEVLARSGKMLGLSIGELVRQIPATSVSLLVGLVSFYFFLKDGRKFILFLEKNSFFDPHQTQELFESITLICRSVIMAALVSGLVQAVLAIFVCALVGGSNLALIGLSIFFGSFIPVVGSMPVSLIITLIAFIKIGATEGTIVLINGMMLIGIDSLIRPWFLRGTVNLHPLLAFITALGGVQLLGFAGIFIGPIIAAIFVKLIPLLNSALSSSGNHSTAHLGHHPPHSLEKPSKSDHVP
jgi:predicted PurR-regulated permease PerM